MTQLTVAILGQSNGSGLWNLTDSNAPTPSSNTGMWNGVAWDAVTGNGAIEFCNRLHTTFGVPIKLFPVAVGGYPLCQQSATGDPGQYLLNPASGRPLAQFYDMVAAAGVTPDILVYVGSESDTNDTDYTTMVAGLGTYYSGILSQIGKTAAQLPFVCGVTGLTTSSGDFPIYVKNAEQDWATSTTGAVLGPAYYDLPRSDGVHYYASHSSGRDLMCLARRLAHTVGFSLGASGYAHSSAGARITGAHALGKKVLVTVQHNGGSVLAPELYFQPVTGFEVFDAGWDQLAIANAYCTGPNSVMIELDADLGSTLPIIRYQQRNSADPANPAYDNNVPIGDTIGCPLMPAVVTAVTA